MMLSSEADIGATDARICSPAMASIWAMESGAVGGAVGADGGPLALPFPVPDGKLLASKTTSSPLGSAISESAEASPEGVPVTAARAVFAGAVVGTAVGESNHGLCTARTKLLEVVPELVLWLWEGAGSSDFGGMGGNKRGGDDQEIIPVSGSDLRTRGKVSLGQGPPGHVLCVSQCRS